MAAKPKQYNQSAAKKLMTYSDLAQTKSVTIDSPTFLQEVTLFLAYTNVNIETIQAVLVGSDDPLVRFELRAGTSRAASPGKLIGVQANNVTSTTTPDVFSFDVAQNGPVEDNWLWLKITDVQGTVDSITLTLTCRGGVGDTVAVAPPPPPPPPDFDTITWTTVPTVNAADRDIYVSSSTGADSTTFDGTHGSITNPYATIAAGKAKMRAAHGDRMWLKKGDTWTEAIGTWTLSGYDATRPMIVGAYGTGARPKLNTGSANCVTADSVAISNVWFMGIEAYANTYNGTDTIYGVAINGQTHNNLLIENCYFHKYRYGVYIAGTNVGSTYPGSLSAQNVTVRGCTVANCYRNVSGYSSGAGVSAGIYTYNINGLLVEFCCFDRNGYNDPAYVNYLRRNVYHDNVNQNAIYRSNLFFGTDGIQLRSGGELTGNVFSRACSAITLGAGTPPVDPAGISVTCEDNVILEGQDVVAAASIRNSGITISNVTGGTIKRNIVASGGTLSALATPCAWWFSNTASYRHNCRNTTIQENITHNWGGYCIYFDNPVGNYASNVFSGNVFQNPDNTIFYAPEGGRVIQSFPALTRTQFSFSNNHYLPATGSSVNVSSGGSTMTLAQWFTATGDSGSANAEVVYVDPDRTIGTYNVTLGGADDHQEFEDACIAMDMDTWDDDYTAPPIVAYLKEGFTEV